MYVTKLLRQQYGIKVKLIDEIDSLDPDHRHYDQRKSDLVDRLAHIYDKIDDMEQALINARTKKQKIEAEKISGDNIYQILSDFNRLYALMNEVERHDLFAELISEIQVHPEQ